MATINLGAIKFNWKGPYNNGTAYAVDDVVSSGGSSYVCILASTGNAVSNGTYWQIMSSAGTNGTDLTSTLTTQGDIVYRDGSGLARLGYGTSGQALLTGGAGANPSWGNVSSDFVKLAETTVSSGVGNVSFEHGTGNIDFTSGAYQYFKIFFKDVHMNGDNDRVYLYAKASGGSYLTSSANYREVRMQLSGTSESNLHNDSDNVRIFGGGTDTARTNYSTMNGEITLMNFDDADNHSSILHHTHMSFIDSSSNDFFSIGAHMVRVAGVHDGIKFQGGSNINRGKFALYGIK